MRYIVVLKRAFAAAAELDKLEDESLISTDFIINSIPNNIRGKIQGRSFDPEEIEEFFKFSMSDQIFQTIGLGDCSGLFLAKKIHAPVLVFDDATKKICEKHGISYILGFPFDNGLNENTLNSIGKAPSFDTKLRKITNLICKTACFLP